jgi:hypothetical protein
MDARHHAKDGFFTLSRGRLLVRSMINSAEKVLRVEALSYHVRLVERVLFHLEFTIDGSKNIHVLNINVMGPERDRKFDDKECLRELTKIYFKWDSYVPWQSGDEFVGYAVHQNGTCVLLDKAHPTMSTITTFAVGQFCGATKNGHEGVEGGSETHDRRQALLHFAARLCTFANHNIHGGVNQTLGTTVK